MSAQQWMYLSVFLSLLQHEDMSVDIFKNIVISLKAENKDVFKEHGLDDTHVIFITKLIKGANTSEVQT